MSKKKIAILNENILFEFAKAEKSQQSQIFDAQLEAQEIREKLDLLERIQLNNITTGEEIISELENLITSIDNQELSNTELKSIDSYFDDYLESIQNLTPLANYDINKAKEIITKNNWDSYYDNITKYSQKIGVNDNEDLFLSLLGEQEYKQLEEEINSEFSRKTSINNKNDLKFLTIAIALTVTKGLLTPFITGKLEYGKSFNPDDRLNHDDKSIENSHKTANQELN